jgi:hypothetical protein
MKAQERWGHPQVRHQVVTAAPKTLTGAIKTGNKTARVQKAINRMAYYSSDAA